MPQITTDVDFADASKEKQYGLTYSTGGLTIRQHFAISILQGSMAGVKVTVTPEIATALSKEAVMVADALIVELNQGE